MSNVMRTIKKKFSGNARNRNKSMDWTLLGTPENTGKGVTVKIDPNSNTGYRGLPKTWETLLYSQGVTKADIDKAPDVAKAIASIHFQGGISELFNNMRSLQGDKMMKKLMEQAVEIKKSSPSEYYSYDYKKDRIGGGSFGEVFRVKDSKSGQVYAMKVSTSDKLRILEREIRMHALSNGHSNIVSFKEAFQNKKRIYLIVEMMDSGSLFDYIYMTKPIKWKEKAIVYVIRGVLKGLAFMHSRYHLHRDIKSQNILINSRGEIKIADFGFAVGLTKEKKKRQTVLGSPFWMAPELIGKEPYGPGVDCWATAITTFEMAENQPPHMGETAVRVLFLVKSEPPPKLSPKRTWSPLFEHYLKISLMKNPRKRPTTHELLMHPLFDKPNHCSRRQFADMISQIKDLKKQSKK